MRRARERPGRASCGFLETRDSAEVTGGPDLAEGQWHKVSCIKTATSIALVVDSRTVATKEVRLGTIANTDPVVFGTYRGSGPGPAGHFLGTLDEALIEMR